MVDPELFMKGGGMSKKKKGYAKGGAGFAKPHNYFAGGSVTNNLKSK
jgi:hypothetical protein